LVVLGLRGQQPTEVVFYPLDGFRRVTARTKRIRDHADTGNRASGYA
jgi:hypothetical protein